MARLSKYALQLKVRGRPFKGVRERVRRAKAVCFVPESLCACAFINDRHYAERNQDYGKHRNGQLLESQSPNVLSAQTRAATDAHLDDLFCDTLQAIRKTSLLDELYVDYHKFDSAWSVQSDSV